MLAAADEKPRSKPLLDERFKWVIRKRLFDLAESSGPTFGYFPNLTREVATVEECLTVVLLMLRRCLELL